MWSPSAQTWHVALSPQRLVLAKPAAFWPGKRADYHSMDCLPGVQAQPWQPAVAALATWLDTQAGAKPTLRVVLSGRFVRWQLLPWRPEITQPDELAAYATWRFRETFGHGAEDWQVLHSPQPPGKAVLACAVDAALLAALRAACQSAGARLAAVSPYFACAFDRWRHVVGKKTAWFGLIESETVSLGLLRDGNWVGLRTQRVNAHWRDALPGLMAQISISAGVADAALPLYLAGDGEPPAPAAGLTFTWLQPKAQAQRALPGGRMALGF